MCGPAKSWVEHGTLDTPVEYFFGIAHAQARYLGLLEKDEMTWEIDDWRERIRKFTGQTAVQLNSRQGEKRTCNA